MHVVQRSLERLGSPAPIDHLSAEATSGTHWRGTIRFERSGAPPPKTGVCGGCAGLYCVSGRVARMEDLVLTVHDSPPPTAAADAGGAPTRQARLLLVDDHAIVREGLVSLFEEEADIVVAGETDSAQAALAFVGRQAVDVVVLDLRMPGLPAPDAVRALLAAKPGLRIVILTSFFEDNEVHAVLSAGAHGFLLKDASRDEILAAIRHVAAGESWIHRPVQTRLLKLLRRGARDDDALTQRERQVLDLLGQGLSNKRIALALGITEGTVKGYLRQLFPKIGATDRLQAALHARGLRPDDGH